MSPEAARKFGGRYLTVRPLRATLFVLQPRCFCNFLCVADGCKPTHIEIFVALSPVEGFHEGVVGQPSSPVEVDSDPAVMAPQIDEPAFVDQECRRPGSLTMPNQEVGDWKKMPRFGRFLSLSRSLQTRRAKFSWKLEWRCVQPTISLMADLRCSG